MIRRRRQPTTVTLVCTTSDGHQFLFDAEDDLLGIYALLATGANTKVTVTKADGVEAVYELLPDDVDRLLG